MQIRDIDKKQLIQIETNNSKTQVFNYQNKYILKYIYNQNKIKFKQIINTYKFLENKINIPKLLDFKLEDEKIYLLYEYIKQNSIPQLSEKNIILIAKLLNSFYKQTKQIKIDNNFKNYLLELEIKNPKLQKEIKSFANKINTNNQRIILEDLHLRNFILTKENELYLIDLDNLILCEIEYDLAKFFLLILRNSINNNTNNFIQKFNIFLNNLNINYNKNKILEYLNIVLILKIDIYEKSNNSLKKKLYLQIYNFYTSNKKNIETSLLTK